MSQIFADGGSGDAGQGTGSQGSAGGAGEGGTAGGASGNAAGSNAAGGESGKDGKDGKGGASGSAGSGDKKYSDADLDRIINQKFAKWQENQQKAVSEAEKLAKMDAQQKAEYERDQMKKQLDALTKQNTLSEMGKTARRMLSEGGITIPDELVSMIITEDAEGTKANVTQFSTLFKAAVQEGVKDALKGKAPSSGSNSSAVTKDSIMKIKDRVERQRMIAERMDLFK